MVLKEIKPYFYKTNEKNQLGNLIIEGNLTCCKSHSFQVFIFGKVQRNILFGRYLSAKDGKISLTSHCKKCKKVIPIFDSRYDGYETFEKCHEKRVKNNCETPFHCKKCSNNDFSIHIKYEYPNIEELNEENDSRHSYTWIWVSLKCNKCGKKYKNLIDYETG